jgi:carboxylesterase type B
MSTTCFFAAFSFLIATPFSLAQSTPSSEPSVTLDSGVVRGTTTALPDANFTVNQFLGIPFAEPPVGDLRFAAPRQVEAWSDTFDATSQPMACIQWTGPEDEREDDWVSVVLNDFDRMADDEDCLYLNVYAPAGGEPDKPVLFWIYGGSGFAGSISDPVYDGSGFAAYHDIVVVAANYRLNGMLVEVQLESSMLTISLSLWRPTSTATTI